MAVLAGALGASGAAAKDMSSLATLALVPAYDTPIVLAQAAVGSATPTADFIFNQCQEIDHQKGPTSAFHVVDPAAMLSVYWASIGRKLDLADIKVTLLQGSTHGKITSVIDNTGRSWYRYDPAPGYLGDDQAKFMADAVYEGKHYRTMIIVQIKVLESVDEKSPSCPDPVMIKAPKPSSGDSGFGTGYNLASVSVNFADLAGVQTIGDAPRFPAHLTTEHTAMLAAAQPLMSMRRFRV